VFALPIITLSTVTRPALARAALAPASGQTGAQASLGAQPSSASNASNASSGFTWPERVISGNAIAVMMPLQVAFVGYMPRIRIGVQYDYQLDLPHWLHIGIAALFDRGDFETFKLDSCGFGASPPEGSCLPGTVAGFDLWAGYAHKWYLKDSPFLVPFARASLGGGWWKYPKITESRLQSLDWSGSMSLRFGGGARLFLLDYLALGVDAGFTLGFTRSSDVPLGGEAGKVAKFLLGMEISPLIVEYRF
jgi:hypothetical protein